LPSRRDVLFSLKTFAGAILALWIALRIGLDRPYWAMATAYIVAQPLAGATRSKAVYRFVGTLLGAVAMLVLIPNLVNAPEMLIAGLILWLGMCIYFAVLDRTPRSYVFLLAGYTVALIGFPAVETPGAAWDIVLARVEEITLGIICSTVVGNLVFPAPLGPALATRLTNWLQNATTWTVGVLSFHEDEAEVAAGRRRVAGDAVEIGLLAGHLAYDTSKLQAATLAVTVLQQRVMLLLPVVDGIADRLLVLREADAISPPLAQLLNDIADWIKRGRAAPLGAADALHEAIDALEPAIDAQSDWQTITLTGLLVRLRELTDLVHDIKALRQQISEGRAHLPTLALAPADSRIVLHHRDHVMALHSALGAVVAIGLICAFWIASAWPEGSGAAALAAVGCAFFAAQDDPAPSIVAFNCAALLSLIIDAVYLFAVLPQVHDFEILVLVLAVVFIPLGILAAMPATARAFGPVSFVTATELALSSAYNADFAAYVNGAIAALVGLGATAIIIRIVRSVSADWTAKRLLRRNRADIAHAAYSHAAGNRYAFAGLLADRLSLVVPRLAASAANADARASEALADLRVGVNILDLQHSMQALGPAARHAISTVLDGVGAHFRHPPRHAQDDLLLANIDHAMQATAADSGPAVRTALLHLAGIRRALFRSAAPYQPALAAAHDHATAGNA
jgi:uncharacterized membrane protein YccC